VKRLLFVIFRSTVMKYVLTLETHIDKVISVGRSNKAGSEGGFPSRRRPPDAAAILQLLCQAVYPLWWPSLTKDMQTEHFLCWSGMTDTEHSKTSSSSEEEDTKNKAFLAIGVHRIQLQFTPKIVTSY